MHRRLLQAAQMIGWRLAWVGPLWLVRPRYVVLVRDLARPLEMVAAAPESLGLRRAMLTRADVPALLAMDPTLLPQELDRRISEGQECVLYWCGSRIALYRWETTRSPFLPYLGVTLRLLPGDTCTTWTFTHPDFRGRGVMACSSAEELRRQRRCGRRRSIGLVSWWNEPSLRVARDRAGRSVAGTISLWRFGAARHLTVSGAVRLDSPEAFHVAADEDAGSWPSASRSPQVATAGQ